MTKTTTTDCEPPDAVTAYALAVERGEIIAGPHVRAAVRRHLSDLESAEARGWRFDRRLAERALNFFPKILRLNGGQFEGESFRLEPWQAFVIGSLFGWVSIENGTRRFQVAYIETGKGSGKSPLAAGIGLYMLTADAEPRAEVYAAATTRDQARILFRDAVAMVEQSPRLSAAILKSGKNPVWNLAHMKSGSFFRPISAERNQSGPRPHCALVDELHEHPDNTVLELLQAGKKGRRNPLVFMITNAGSSRTSVCYDYHSYASKVSAGAIEDDRFFGYVCALDEGDNPFEDESCWVKTNPTLGITIQPEYIRKQVTEAQKMPSKEAIVRRLHFCQWTEAVAPWLSYELWSAAASPDFPLEKIRNRKCWGGLDLSSTTDITALVLAFEPTQWDPVWRLMPYFWLPDRGLADKADKDKVPYLVWRDHGFLFTTDSNAIDKRSIVRQLAKIASQFSLQQVAYDRHGIKQLQILLEEEGVELPMMDFGQGYVSMSPAIGEFEALLLNGELKHNGNPVLTWNAANAVTTQDPAGNRKLDKSKATGRIDGVVAAVMAIGAAKLAEAEGSLDGFLSNPVRG